MNILVTAGNTQILIDRVRCLTNVFTGRTGTRIALDAHGRGHAVTLFTSHPEVVAELSGGARLSERWTVRAFRTFEDLMSLMKEAFTGQTPDAFVHSAAVSDFTFAGAFGVAPGKHFDPKGNTWHGNQETPTLMPRRGGKLKSDEPELWLRLVRAPKLIDMVRADWGFRGVLVKFKLEVDVSEERLLEIAEESRRQSDADLIAANTLEGAGSWAYLGPLAGRYERLACRDLSTHLLDAVEQVQVSRSRIKG